MQEVAKVLRQTGEAIEAARKAWFDTTIIIRIEPTSEIDSLLEALIKSSSVKISS